MSNGVTRCGLIPVAPPRLAPLRSAFLRSAFLRLAPPRWAPPRLAPLRSAPPRLAPPRLAPLRSAQDFTAASTASFTEPISRANSTEPSYRCLISIFTLASDPREQIRLPVRLVRIVHRQRPHVWRAPCPVQQPTTPARAARVLGVLACAR